MEQQAPCSAGSESAQDPVPYPRGRAHLCRWHTRSGRCGDTPSGSSPRWLLLAGSSSTSVHAPGNSEQGGRDVERQRDPVRAQRRRREPQQPQQRGQRGCPRFSPAPPCLSQATCFLPCQRTANHTVPVTWLSAAMHEVSTCHTTPLDDTEPTAVLHGAGGQGTWPGLLPHLQQALAGWSTWLCGEGSSLQTAMK